MYKVDPTSTAESKEELKTLLNSVKEESEKAGLKHNVQKTQIMASGLIQFTSVIQSCPTLCVTSWQIDERKMETASDFILGGSKITVDGDCNHKIKRCLLLRRKVMTNLVLSMCSATQSCPSSCDPMDCSLPGFFCHGIFPARILEQAPISSSRGSSWPSDRTWVSGVSCIGRWILYHWATWKPWQT